MADPDFARFVRGLMEEATPTLRRAAGDRPRRLQGRAASSASRNPALKHRTWQIAMDGSQKLPQRLLGTIRDRLRRGAPFDRLALGVAGWMRYVTGIDEKGRPIDVRDPLAARLRAIADAAGPTAERLAPALLAVEAIFGSDLAADPRFPQMVMEKLEALIEFGAKRTIAGS